MVCLLRMHSMVPDGAPKSPSWQGARSGVLESWVNPGGQLASQKEPLEVFAAQFQVVPPGDPTATGPGRLGHAAPAIISNSSNNNSNHSKTAWRQYCSGHAVYVGVSSIRDCNR
jgi:hypothetical protein